MRLSNYVLSARDHRCTKNRRKQDTSVLLSLKKLNYCIFFLNEAVDCPYQIL